jgi:hypothetical protein
LVFPPFVHVSPGLPPLGLTIFIMMRLMTMEHSLVTLLHTYTESENPPIIELLNIDNKPVGALYLSQLRYKQFVVTETNNTEKYFLVIDGVGIYFSFFRKIAV